MTTRESSAASGPLSGGLTRRQMLSTIVLAGGAIAAGFDRAWPAPPSGAAAYGFPNGRVIGTVPFSEEGNATMNTVLDAGLDGRLMTDLGALPWKAKTVPTGQFYIRTRASTLISSPSTWTVTLGDPEAALSMDLGQLRREAKPRGIQVLECSGNGRGRHFGLMSAAEWQGVPLLDVLSRQLPPTSESARVVVSGFDVYKATSKGSVPGASWNFSRAQLQDTGAFLATGMNGGELPLDHGAPVRLVVPGWYGCTCIKWVDQIEWVGEDEPATSQMKEYAGRTEQDGIPELAKEFAPAAMEPAAMPIRIEQWQVGDEIRYVIVGILWGRPDAVKRLEIQVASDGPYAPVPVLEPARGEGWRFWAYRWTPDHPGDYTIRLRVAEPALQTRRLDRGYYARTVRIDRL